MQRRTHDASIPSGIRVTAAALLLIGLALAGCGDGSPSQGAGGFSDELTFNRQPLGADADRGRAVFGIAADGIHGDPSQALFVGRSTEAGADITSNGRTCFTCHRPEANFMINPLLPFDQHLAPDDPLIRPDAIVADSGGNPDAPQLLNDFGLVLIRPHRFDAPPSDPRFRAFGFRKSMTNLNTVFGHGFLNDLRTADLPSTDLGAVMSHTQNLDAKHDDMIPAQTMDDLAAFQFTLFTKPELRGLAAGPSDPDFQRLAREPFVTVPVRTAAERHGQAVFQRDCFPCHNVPNVFNNRAHRDPAAGVPVGEGLKIGVAEVNTLGLDFRDFDARSGEKHVVDLPLVDDEGRTVIVSLNQDPGLALITGRLADLGKFKVPQLRNLRIGKPYFHDCSAPDLDAVIAYFNSSAYNESADGRRFSIHMTDDEKADLMTFLLLL